MTRARKMPALFVALAASISLTYGCNIPGLGTSGSTSPGTPYTCTGYRLPTEAEWEYAYRAGTTTAFHNGAITQTTGDDPKLDLIGWYGSNSGSTTHLVGLKQANAWGLHDMAGNVWEWTGDMYGSYPKEGSATDPVGPQSGSTRVHRGGSYGGMAYFARAANRNDTFNAGDRDNLLGFRLARSRP